MSSAQIQKLSSLIVAIGVGLCATFGAQLTPKTLDAVTADLVSTHQLKEGQTSESRPTPEVEEPSARVMTWWSRAALPFGGGLLLIFLGSMMARRAKHALIHITGDGEGGGAEVNLAHTLGVVISTLDEIFKRTQSKEWSQLLAEIKIEIEEIQTSHLEPLIENRERIKAELGMELFIDIFGPIAQGERKLNRAWAACVDKHSNEAVTSLQSAYTSFQSALQGAVQTES